MNYGKGGLRAALSFYARQRAGRVIDAAAMSNIHLPHEIQRPDQLFTCWPASRDYWPAELEQVWPEYAAFLRTTAEVAEDAAPLSLTILVASDEAEESARAAVGDVARLVRHPYGDVWTRDTGPVFLRRDGELIAVRFRHNGWGGKYLYPGDAEVGEKIAELAGARIVTVDLVGEGGALEFDGEGTLLTTRQCLLNPNRNPGLGEKEVEQRLIDALGVEKILWIDEGMVADHTDGHIDNIVRFVRPGVVVCQEAFGADDAQTQVFADIKLQLEAMTDARGRKLEVHTIPGPGRFEDEDGELMPASYMNWVIGPENLVVPTYGSHSESEALQRLRTLFPTHRIVGSRSDAILTGGGAFHCVTCHVPGEAPCSVSP